MRTTPLLAAALLLLAARDTPAQTAADKAPPAPPQAGPVKRVDVGPNVTLEIQGETRRIVVPAVVCYRDGPLELLLCRKNTKEHEAVLSADVDARTLHAALLAAGADAGSPAKFEPKYAPASGTVVKVSVRYTDGGKDVTRPAQEWVREMKSKKPMTHNWVFAGSIFFDNPDDPKAPKQYAANGGDVICVSNFPTAMLDIPVNSPMDNDDLQFEAFTDRIPELGTKVTVILEPVKEKKAEKK